MTRPMDVVLRSAGDRAVPRVITAQGALDDRALAARIDALVMWLAKTGMRRVASRLDNGPSWFVLDLALREVGGVHVPLPMFFSEAQMRHALANSGAFLEAKLLSGQTPTLAPDMKADLLKLVHDIKPDDMDCVFIRQPRPLGLGHAVLCAEPGVGDSPFAVLLANDPAGTMLGCTLCLLHMIDGQPTPRRA